MLGFYSISEQPISTLEQILTPVVGGRHGGAFYKKKRDHDKVAEETQERLWLERTISEIYDRIEGFTEEEKQEVIEVLPVKKEEVKKILLPTFDITGLLNDIRTLERIIALHERAKEEELMMVFALV